MNRPDDPDFLEENAAALLGRPLTEQEGIVVRWGWVQGYTRAEAHQRRRADQFLALFPRPLPGQFEGEFGDGLTLEEAHDLVESTGLVIRSRALASETMRMMVGDEGEAPEDGQTLGVCTHDLECPLHGETARADAQRLHALIEDVRRRGEIVVIDPARQALLDLHMEMSVPGLRSMAERLDHMGFPGDAANLRHIANRLELDPANHRTGGIP
jgi:hypothetical protein